VSTELREDSAMDWGFGDDMQMRTRDGDRIGVRLNPDGSVSIVNHDTAGRMSGQMRIDRIDNGDMRRLGAWIRRELVG
jgi:hypothetical protein